MMRRACLGGMLAVLWLCGCGDDSGGGGGNVQAPSTLDPALGAMCDLLTRCPEFHPLATRSRRECVDVLYWLLTCRLDEQNDELVGVRRVELNLTRAQSEACAAVFSSVSCEDLNGSLNTSLGSDGAACLPLFAGFSDDDESDDVSATGCQYSGQCPNGQYCPVASYDDAMDAPACRACRGALQRGETCVRYNSTVPCDEGLVCVDDGGGVRGPTTCAATRSQTAATATTTPSAKAASATTACTNVVQVVPTTSVATTTTGASVVTVTNTLSSIAAVHATAEKATPVAHRRTAFHH